MTKTQQDAFTWGRAYFSLIAKYRRNKSAGDTTAWATLLTDVKAHTGLDDADTLSLVRKTYGSDKGATAFCDLHRPLTPQELQEVARAKKVATALHAIRLKEDGRLA